MPQYPRSLQTCALMDIVGRAHPAIGIRTIARRILGTNGVAGYPKFKNLENIGNAKYLKGRTFASLYNEARRIAGTLPVGV